jgi:hypothetical protein
MGTRDDEHGAHWHRHELAAATGWMVMIDWRLAVKRKLILSLGLVIGFGQLALADEHAAPSPQMLGMVEAIIDKCAEIDPTNADRYHGQTQIATQGASIEAVAKARKSDEYKEAYVSTADSLTAISAPDAVKTCRGSLVERK